MIYCTTDWLEVEESCLNDDFLMKTFVDDIHRTIYVLRRGGGIKGVVSHGDFCRHILCNTPLIQEKFTSCTVRNEEEAKEILRIKSNIYGIPVLDSENRIIREWRKEVREKEGFSNHILFGLYKQFLSDRSGYLNILVMDLSGQEDAETAKNINTEAAGKLLIVDKRDILNIERYFKDTKPGVVYDNVQKYADFHNLIYKKLQVKPEFLKKSNATEEILNRILEFYASVGILASEAGGLSDAYQRAEPVYIFEDEKFTWNEEENCFEYSGYIEDDKVPEILWVSCCILKNPCIKYQNKMLPIESGSYSIYEKYVIDYYTFNLVNKRTSDYDIVYNIIPQLNEKKIKFVILSNIDEECGEIKGFNMQEAERRAVLEAEYINSRPNQYFNLSGKVSAAEICDELRSASQGWQKRGYKEFKDYKGKHINISRGERLVLDNPADSEHKLWLFGSCLIRGACVDDASNIGSVLRKKIDNHYYIKNMGAMHETQNLCMRDAILSEGDIVVIQAYDNAIYERAGLRIYSLLDIYNECSDLMEHVTDAPNHADAYLMKKIAERIYEILLKGNMLKNSDDEKKPARENVPALRLHLRKDRNISDIPLALQEWLAGIKDYKGEPFLKTGAIVMNCNPFTLGHRYLIEQACEQVDKLLIFVVEEDKSFFQFKDRLKMVRIGTKDLKKVSIIPSGKYIISSETLPGYFEKDKHPEISLDATDDLELFAKVIAKNLNINVRFAGEEPLDGVTRQYNQEMERVLPQNDIEFVEIPRKEKDGSVISASRVRKLLKEKNYSDVKELVSPQVYDYLAKNYFI